MGAALAAEGGDRGGQEGHVDPEAVGGQDVVVDEQGRTTQSGGGASRWGR